LDYPGVNAAKTIDDLMVEPQQDSIPEVNSEISNATAILLSTNASRQDKVEAMIRLERFPSSEASKMLQEVAKTDKDLYVRERAIMTLAQFKDPGAIPALVEIGLNPPSSEVKMAAYNAVWVLRKHFPLSNPPKISIKVIDTIQLGEDFNVEATILSPVDRKYARIIFEHYNPDLIFPVELKKPAAYEGPLKAGTPVVLLGRFLAKSVGQTRLTVSVRLSANFVDVTNYSVPLYIDIKDAVSTVSMTPFPGWEEDIIHNIPINGEEK